MNSETRSPGEIGHCEKLAIRIIANPAAGRAGNKKISDILDYLGRRGAEAKAFITGKRGDAIEATRRAVRESKGKKIDMVVAAGGDGTINEVVNGLMGSDIPLGVIPLGTVNVYALETGIPQDYRKACDVLLEGEVRKVRVGKINDRYFVLMAGVGFDADVVYRLDLGLKKNMGKLAYVLTGIGRLARYDFKKLDIEIDGGRRYEGCSVVIGNMKYYGGRVSVTPLANFDKDTLDVCIFKGGGAINMIRYTFGVLRKRHLSYEDVEYLSVKSLRVFSKTKTYIQVDGDVYGVLPAEFAKADERLSVILPAHKTEKGELDERPFREDLRV